MINQRLATMLTTEQAKFCGLLTAGIATAEGTIYAAMTATDCARLAGVIAENVIAHFAGTKPIEIFAERMTRLRVHDPDYTPESIAVIIQIIATALTSMVNSSYPIADPEYPAIQAAVHDLVLRDSTACFVVYATEREQALRASLADHERLVALLRERSMPIMPVYDGILVVPVIGQMDTIRAQELTEDLLTAIVESTAEQVIIDLTGVPKIDPTSVNQIVQMTKAVALLGASVLLVGIDGTMAQTLTQLGVQLSHVHISAHLQDGIAAALAQYGFAIQPITTAYQGF
ncbi:STAS domain-containing protein [Herpetosiphon llansteffanensis]